MKRPSSVLRRIVVPDLRRTKAGRDRLSGIFRYCDEKPAWQVVLTPMLKNERDARNLIHLAAQADGLIYDSGKLDHLCQGQIDGKLPVPFVALEANLVSPHGIRPDAEVGVDNAAVACAAADLLLRRGLTRISYVKLPVDYNFINVPHSSRRARAIAQHLQSKSVAFSSYIAPDDQPWDRMMADFIAWLEAQPTPFGVIAFNDDNARVVLDACHLAHLRVPDQVRIVGIDNDVAVCEGVRPTLSSVLPDFEGAGYLAAQLMDEILTHGRPRRPLRRSCGVKEVVERLSTQDVKGGGRLVALAREIIRARAKENLKVSALAAELHVSYALLERRFGEVLGRSVATEIRRTKLKEVCRRLRETDDTLANIAAEAGFASSTHLQLLFKKTFGCTMRAYRNGQGAAAPSHPARRPRSKWQ
jgi:LacI family transcriptional regulator